MSVVVALALLHFLWQGAVIGLAAWVAMKIARSASARYAIGVAALLVMAMAPVLTATWIKDGVVPGPGFRVPSSSPGVPGSSGVPESVQFVQDPGRTPDPRTRTRDSGPWTLDDMRKFVSVSPSFAKLLLYSWLLGVALLSVRLSLGLWTARRLTRLSVRMPQPEILSNAERLMAALNITAAVKVLESALVQVPTAMGWLKPVVLLPAQAMTGLSMAQIDALVAHELAHIKRHDYLVNLLQSAIETLLFYHPVVWLISRRVRHERELCCDDMAIAACGDDRLTYASALADLESLRQVPAPMLAANGGSLLTRVKRILSPDDVQTVRGTGHWLAGVAILLTVLIGAAAQSVQGRQVVQGVAGGVKASVTGGVSGGIKDATPGGIVGGVKDGVAGGVIGGVEGNVLGAVDAADQQKIAIGQIIRLEVTVSQAATTISPRVLDLTIGAAFADWNRAKGEAESTRVEFDRLAKVDLGTPDAALAAAEAVPVLSTDAIVTNYVNQIRTVQTSRQRMKTEQSFADGHPRMLAADAEIVSLTRQLTTRLRSIVDTARLNADAAKAAEVRFKTAYDSVTASPSHGVAHTARDISLSKDYTVQEDGTILLPYAGSVKAAGLTLVALQDSARVALRAQGQPILKVLASIEARALDSLPKLSPMTEKLAQPLQETPKAAITSAPAPPSVAPAAVSQQTAKQVPGYVIGPADVLRVTVYSGGQSQPDFRAVDYTVQTDGTVALPLIRPLGVSGLSVAAANEVIRKALLEGAIFNEATVDVVVMGYHSSHLKVQGAVNKPGNLEMSGDKMNLADALAAAGNLQPSAGAQIQVRRSAGGDWEVFTRADLNNGKLGAVKLTDGDTINVPVAPKYFVQGFVTQPGEVQWEENLTLERALLKVGGVTKDGAILRTEIRRMDPKTKKYAPISLEKDPTETIIMIGDVIMVPKRRM